MVRFTGYDRQHSLRRPDICTPGDLLRITPLLGDALFPSVIRAMKIFFFFFFLSRRAFAIAPPSTLASRTFASRIATFRAYCFLRIAIYISRAVLVFLRLKIRAVRWLRYMYTLLYLPLY